MTTFTDAPDFRGSTGRAGTAEASGGVLGRRGTGSDLPAIEALPGGAARIAETRLAR